MTTTGREPSLSQDSNLSGREPALGKDALRKHLYSAPLESWDDPRVKWGRVRAMRFELATPLIPPMSVLQSDRPHPLIETMRMFQQLRGVIQLSLSPYRGLFLRINTVDTVSTPLRYDFDIGCELTVMGQIAELDLVATFPADIVLPPVWVIPEYIVVRYRNLSPPTSLGYFNPVID